MTYTLQHNSLSPLSEFYSCFKVIVVLLSFRTVLMTGLRSYHDGGVFSLWNACLQLHLVALRSTALSLAAGCRPAPLLPGMKRKEAFISTQSGLDRFMSIFISFYLLLLLRPQLPWSRCCIQLPKFWKWVQSTDRLNPAPRCIYIQPLSSWRSRPTPPLITPRLRVNLNRQEFALLTHAWWIISPLPVSPCVSQISQTHSAPAPGRLPSSLLPSPPVTPSAAPQEVSLMPCRSCKIFFFSTFCQ